MPDWVSLAGFVALLFLGASVQGLFGLRIILMGILTPTQDLIHASAIANLSSPLVGRVRSTLAS